jgi:endonuclease/exonuclease/phosphatase family metal-dependent hydrolase
MGELPLSQATIHLRVPGNDRRLTRFVLTEARGMPRFLPWNMDAGRDVDDERRPFGQLLAGLVSDHAIDVLLLVECSLRAARILPQLQGEPGYHVIPGPDRFRVFARFPPEYMKPIDVPVPSDRIGLWHLTLPLQQEAIIALVHGFDRRNNGPAKRELFLSQVVSQVSWAEKKLGHERTIVAGDFNANPFERELGSTSGMHAVMTSDLASAEPRRLLDKEYGFFYNPMWILYGDRQDGKPAGTYYFDGGQPHEWYWHMLDQVLVRPVLIPRLPLTSLRIITAGPSGNLATPGGRPDRKKGSDHFPIVLDLELRSDHEGAFNEQGSLARV